MNIELTGLEARLIGCLIEKQLTTPDQYPLSLNSLVSACNQKSNRDPMMDLDERTVQQILNDLVKKHFVIERSGFGSRVPKYQHVFCNTEFGSLKFTPAQLGILVELLLRGPQTPGELRTRVPRLGELRDPNDIDAALEELLAHVSGPFIARLPRESGRRDHRYAQLFCGPIENTVAEADSVASAPRETAAIAQTHDDIPPAIDENRMARLESLVESLGREIDSLKKRLDG